MNVEQDYNGGEGISVKSFHGTASSTLMNWIAV